MGCDDVGDYKVDVGIGACLERGMVPTVEPGL